MYDDVDKTISRPPLRTKRTRTERSYASRGRNSTYDDDRYGRQASRGERSNGGRGSRARGSSYQSRSSSYAHGGGVPVPIVVLLIIACVVGSVFATRCALMPQVQKASADAATAQEQVSALSRQLEQKSKELESARSGQSGTSGDAATANATNTTAASQGVKSPWTKTGYFTSGDSTLDEEVKDFCDSKADSSMQIDAAALEVYKGIAWSDYQERDNAQHPSGKDWRLTYAKQYYESGCSGNCYEFASFLGYCLQYMGFDDAKAEGVLVQLQSGGWGDHGIVYVTNTDGVASICDTARGTDGWMLPEGTYNVQLQDFENA